MQSPGQLKLLARIAELREQAEGAHDTEAIAVLDVLRERVERGELAGTMREMLPVMQTYAAKLSFVPGVLLMFYYRLKMLQAEFT